MVEFFFFGVHESCLHDIPMMTCVVLLLLSLLNRKRLLFIAVGLYAAQILYHFLLLGTIGRGMADRESPDLRRRGFMWCVIGIDDIGGGVGVGWLS